MMIANAEVPLTFEFGPFRLDLGERLLLRNGEIVPLGPKLLETLAILVEHSGHIIEKDELMKRLWPDSFVDESSLSQNIFQLRKALRDGRSDRRYIETIPKRGYRFVCCVREVAPGYVDSSTLHVNRETLFTNGDWPRLAVKSLAVLPFKPLEKERTD